MRRPVLLSWSSGKDSAWTLEALRRDASVEVVGLFTTLNASHDRVSMHGVRRGLLEAQAAAARLDLWPVALPDPCSEQQYAQIMTEEMGRAKIKGVEAVAFGDLYLEWLRDLRVRQLGKAGLEALFPIWVGEGSSASETHGRTARLAEIMQEAGLRARLTSVDSSRLPDSLVGREWDRALLLELPGEVDACGERGEFHTFAYSGPMFDYSLAVELGESLHRDGYAYADFLLADDQ